MKLSEFLHLLQRYQDLYPNQDPEVIMTGIHYPPFGAKDINSAEFNTHTFKFHCFETKTLVHFNAETIFAERGPYLNIYYEKKYINSYQDFWQNTYFQQIKDSGSSD